MTDAVPENARMIVDITAADKAQTLLALAACAYLRSVKHVTVEQIVSGAPYEDDTGARPTQDLTPLLEFIDWSAATDQFLRYGNALPLRNRLLDAQFDDQAEQGALHGLAKQLEQLSQSMTLLRPVETLDEAIGIRRSVRRLQNIVNDIPEARPIEPLLARIQARFEPFSDAGKLTEPAGFTALAHMITVYLQTEHFVEAITLAREALVTKVCAEEGWHALNERRKAEDKLNALAYDHNQQPLSPAEAELGQLWSRLSDLRNDISHAGFRRYPTKADQATENVRNYCAQAIALLLA